MSEDVVFLSLQNIVEAYFEHDLNKRRQSVSTARLAPVTAPLLPLARGKRLVFSEQVIRNTGEMGCGLPKLAKRSEDNSPGKIYSTLKRPQVETKIGVAYTYRFLDFTLGREGLSGLCLSSVRDLPVQLQDLYQQGFVLAAVHPFIHPCGPEPARIQSQLYRAVLIRLSDSSEKNQSNSEASRLEVDLCLSADQFPNTDLIRGYVKKIQDAAEQGVMFVGFVQQPAAAPTIPGQGGPDEISLSLHSSPSSLPGTESDPEPSPKSPMGSDCAGEAGAGDRTSAGEGEEAPPREAESGAVDSGNAGSSEGTGVEDSQDGGCSLSDPPSPSDHPDHPPTATENDSQTHNNNKAKTSEVTETKNSQSSSTRGMEVFAMFNHPAVRQGLLKYYTVKVPLRVQLRDEGVSGVEANWLDHMTQHFNSGAWLVDGYFHLGNENDLMPKAVESVFIFQEGQEGDSTTATPYDAIVVEQWTVINGVEVKTDYIPLLQSLAMYGWKLTCVLPTPIVKTNSDGSLATKQIVFLQRPTLPRKKRDSKKISFKARSKSNKNSVKDAPKNKKKRNGPSVAEKDAEEQKISEDEEKMCDEESRKVVMKNRENRENERREGSEVEVAAETKNREDGEMVEDQEERETGTEVKNEGRSKTEEGRGEGEETEEKEGGVKNGELTEEGITKSGEEKTKAEGWGEGSGKVQTTEGEAQFETGKEVALETEHKEGQESRTTDKQQGEATGQERGEADDGQVLTANESKNSREGEMEVVVDCASALHVSEVTEITIEAVSSSSPAELSCTETPPTGTD
ncbi:hypothetical protein AGOR_G00211010 [Albula goreensis]|uniref:Raftlin-like n=1 Tax=Albula goreensis TaxID=1534307 RepID=A0A8T3CQU0_9TELE|nr:hypothetical protein AGOR_G00211010 [Albula goreensis]